MRSMALEVGQEREGTVKHLTSYGAFVGLGKIDGLLHNSDISWKRINHPSDVLKVGDKITVKVLDFDYDRSRISLGLKQLEGEDPWQSESVGEKYPVGSKHEGTVTGIRDYGCFVDLGNGIEGLVHVSEMGGRNKKVIPSEVTSVGATVQVMVLEIDNARRRISLGIKQLQDNPQEDSEKTQDDRSEVAVAGEESAEGTSDDAPTSSDQ